MGLQLVCDNCGKSMDELDRTLVSRDSITEGSIRLDLCPDCAEPILKVQVVASKREEQKVKVKKMTEMAKTTSATPVAR